MALEATFQPANIDSYIGANQATTNYGSATEIRIGEHSAITGEIYRGLLKFDGLSDGTIRPNSTINSCVLYLYKYGDISGVIRYNDVYRLKRAWVGSEVTWNVWKTGSNWSSAGGFHADDCEQTRIGRRINSAGEGNGFKDWTLDNAAIQEIVAGTWANNGFLIRTDAETNDGYQYYSSNYAVNAALRPYLYVNWTINTYVKTINSVTSLNVKTLNGNDISDTKSVLGLP